MWPVQRLDVYLVRRQMYDRALTCGLPEEQYQLMGTDFIRERRQRRYDPDEAELVKMKMTVQPAFGHQPVPGWVCVWPRHAGH